MQRFGPQSSANLRLAQNVYSGQYDLTHTRGGHLLKAGVDRRALPRLHDQPDVQPRHLHLRQRPRLPREPRRRASSASGRPATSIATGRGPIFAAYAQDNYQVTPTSDGQRRPPLRGHDDAGGRGRPRFGADQSDRRGGDGRSAVRRTRRRSTCRRASAPPGTCSATASTSVRGGYGLYFNTNNQQNLIVTVTNPPATPRFVIANPTFPTPPFERGVGNTIRPVQWDLEAPRLHMWNVSVQRSLPANLIATDRLRRLARHAPVPQHRHQHPDADAGRRRPSVLRRRPAASEHELRHHRAEEQRRRELVQGADRRTAAQLDAGASRCSRRTRCRAPRTRRRRRPSSRMRPTARRSRSRSSIRTTTRDRPTGTPGTTG